MLLAEHHFTNYCAIPNPLMLAAAVGQRTSRLRIGTAVIVLPLHNPVRVAEDVAELSAQGDLFDIQGGTVSLALGGSYRRDAFTQVTDPQSQGLWDKIAGTVVIDDPDGRFAPPAV